MQKNKAPGRDGICTEHIQFYYSDIKMHLLHIFKACFQYNYFPKAWKTATVLVIPKPGKTNHTDPTSYWSISLLPVLGKILEPIILKRLQKEAKDGGWISAHQHGFQENKTKITAIEQLTNQIHHGFNQKAVTTCVLLDIKGAFDNAWHPSIICNLKNKE